MAILYLDCFAGISGDMFLGAMLDLGLPLEVLERELARLPVEGYRLRVSRVSKLGIAATKLDVLLAEAGGERLADSGAAGGMPGHGHGHGHGREHECGHQHRSLATILGLIEASGLDPAVKATAAGIFRRLGEAEATVHGVPVDEVQFHEVGAVDAIVDVAGAAIGLHQLGITGVYASPVHLGQGMVETAHGRYPIPGPATLGLLAGAPVYQTEIRGELTTPTGAAILAAVAGSFGPMPPMRISRVGYGAGTRDRAIPNVLRAVLGEPDAPAAPADYDQGRAVMIEANIDDMNPEFYDHLFDRLAAVGALEVYLTAVQMKKNRPGSVLHVLTAPDRVDPALGIIFAESTTIGIRMYDVSRRMLRRSLRTVQTPYGPVRLKLAYLGGELVNVKPEYEDCKAAALAAGVPLKAVDAAARAAARESGGQQ